MNNLIIKFSGEYFKDERTGNLFSESQADILKDALKEITSRFNRIHLIVGGGNLVRGREYESLVVPRDIYDKVAMSGTSMNALWLASYLKEKGLSAFPISTGKHAFMPQYDQDNITSHKKGSVFIHGGGTNLPYLSTDTLAVILALENDAVEILVAKNGIDGIYTADPNKTKNAKFVGKITFEEILTKQLSFMDVAATAIANKRGLKMKVFKFEDKDSFKKVLDGDLKHSLIY